MPAKRLTLLLILTLCALLSLGYWRGLTQPVDIIDAPSDRLSCVSYAPFHKAGQTPLDKKVPITAAQIEADMTALADRFDCVRTYTVTQGLQIVPELAEKLGIKVLLGIWIGRESAENEQELAAGIELAQKHPQVIRAVIVGNEVLLRQEQTPAGMRKYLQRVAAALPGVAVTYADVWEFWLRYKQDLLHMVAFPTVHILPYWEDTPIAVSDAVLHVHETYRRVKEQLGGKDVLIGETGWPSYGRSRLEAEPSLVNQARFIREFAARAASDNIPYNVIEAFDQPWKRNSEGAVGGYWGLYDTDGKVKFPFHGPVAEAGDWSPGVLAAAAGFSALLAYAQWRRRLWSLAVLWPTLAIGAAAGGAWLAYYRDFLLTSRTWLEWAYSGLFAALLLAAVIGLGKQLAAWSAHGAELPQLHSGARLLALWRADRSIWRDPVWRLSLLRFVFLFSAALVGLILVFDLRSRAFPVALFAPPIIGFTLLAWLGGKAEADLEEKLLAGWVALAGVLTALNEHLLISENQAWRWADVLNPPACAWLALSLLFAAAVLGPASRPLQSRQG